MKCTIKKRGLTLLGVILGIGAVGTSAPTAIHYVVQRRADERLGTIVRNLAGIDMAVAQWSAQTHDASTPSRATLTGEAGGASLLDWPAGPVSGAYSVVRSSGGPEARVVPALATFDGGSKGPMNRLEWQHTCSADPAACGL